MNNNVTRLFRSQGKDGVVETFNASILPNCDTIFVMGVTSDGGLIYDANGVKRKDVLWALEQVKHDVLFRKDPGNGTDKEGA